jgi:hypothetical protein
MVLSVSWKSESGHEKSLGKLCLLCLLIQVRRSLTREVIGRFFAEFS